VVPASGSSEPEFRIEIQNEYLVARHHGQTVAIVPDLIAILDAESAEPLTAEMLAYGQRVCVIGYSAAPIMRRPECLKVFGPRLFGLDPDLRRLQHVAGHRRAAWVLRARLRVDDRNVGEPSDLRKRHSAGGSL
jgi:Protein of unknown function (DUF917)